jgi:hypothetical protein
MPSKSLLLALLLLPSLLKAEPILPGVTEQKACNDLGYFYDHKTGDCTSKQIVSCDSLRIEESKRAEINRWMANLKKEGYTLSQCLNSGVVTMQFLKADLFLKVKTVTVQ